MFSSGTLRAFAAGHGGGKAETAGVCGNRRDDEPHINTAEAADIRDLPCGSVGKEQLMNWMEYFNAFWVGGAICAVCQVFIDKTKLTPARILVGLVVTGVFLQAIGIYQPIVDYAGAGATVPLLGFGYSLAKGVSKAVGESGLLGVFTGGVTGAAGGIAAAIVFGCLFALLSKPKAKS